MYRFTDSEGLCAEIVMKGDDFEGGKGVCWEIKRIFISLSSAPSTF
jgi:hypothetical protein